MPEFKSAADVFDRCLQDSLVKPQAETDIDKIQSILKIAEEHIESGEDDLSKKRLNSAYCSYYTALRELAEAFLLFDKIKALNHQCLFAYLCIKHPELELDWNFFEKVRTKRNGINYYGTLIDYEDWKETELQLNLYIKLLKRKIKEKLK